MFCKTNYIIFQFSAYPNPIPINRMNRSIRKILIPNDHQRTRSPRTIKIHTSFLKLRKPLNLSINKATSRINTDRKNKPYINQQEKKTKKIEEETFSSLDKGKLELDIKAAA